MNSFVTYSPYAIFVEIVVFRPNCKERSRCSTKIAYGPKSNSHNLPRLIFANECNQKKQTVLQTGAIKFRTSITIDVFFLTRQPRPLCFLRVLFVRHKQQRRKNTSSREEAKTAKETPIHSTNFFFLKKVSFKFLCRCVCSCFFDEERNAFFSPGQREREKREKARAKKKKKERFVAFLSRVESIMRGQKPRDDARLSYISPHARKRGGARTRAQR